jgi:hypothetical protein
MTEAEFRQKISELLSTTLDDGPGPRAVAMMTGDALAHFLMNEAGADAPERLNEVIAHMRAILEPADADEDDRIIGSSSGVLTADSFFTIPPLIAARLAKAANVAEAMALVANAVATGELTVTEGEVLEKLAARMGPQKGE